MSVMMVMMMILLYTCMSFDLINSKVFEHLNILVRLL